MLPNSQLNKPALQLLYSGRIPGSYRIGRMWVIPLTGEMPEITPGGRGPKPTKLLNPPVIFNKGNKTLYASEIIIDGPCRLLDQPFQKLCSGAQVWIETLFPTRTIAL